MDEARDFIAKGNLDEAGKRATEAKSTNFDNGKADAIQQEITLLAVKKPEPSLPGPMVPPVETPKIDPPSGRPTPGVDPSPPAYMPTPAPSLPTITPAPPTPTPPKTAAGGAGVIAAPGALFGALYAEFWRNGLLAYFSGDYGEAVRQFETMPQTNAPARMRVFLACARAGVVLTGRGDAALLRTARMDYRDAGGANALPAQDRRFISPKIIELLEKS
jgi:hypothetical protein